MTAAAKRIAIAVVEHRGRFLVGRRPDGVPLGGLWEFPGGKVEEGETPETAAARECLEETGLRVRVGPLCGEHTQAYDHGRMRLLFFACQLRDPAARPRPPFCWVPRADLADYPFPAGNQGLLHHLLHSE